MPLAQESRKFLKTGLLPACRQAGFRESDIIFQHLIYMKTKLSYFLFKILHKARYKHNAYGKRFPVG